VAFLVAAAALLRRPLLLLAGKEGRQLCIDFFTLGDQFFSSIYVNFH
jgi:hypothetical protein